MTWDPTQYGLFEAARARPGHDLMAALPAMVPSLIVDLGCGTGNLTRTLADRWPEARVIGLDSAPAMLAKAAREPSRIAWELGDIEHWHPPGPVDLVFSNAALHWLPDHDRLFPILLRRVADDGVMAVQMPRNFGAPSHLIMRELASSDRWASRLAGVLRDEPVGAPDRYWRLLSPLARHVEIWETEYLHALDGPDPVLEWVKGTGLLPIMAALGPEERPAFTAEYAERLRRAYPPEPGGVTLFPFRRLFIVARP